MKRKNTGLAMLVLAAVFMTAACSPTGVNSTMGNPAVRRPKVLQVAEHIMT